MRFIAIVCALMMPLGATHAHADLYHIKTIPDVRAVSLAYDAAVCGVWVAHEGPQLTLFNSTGRVIRQIDSGMAMVRSLTVERDGLLLADGWGTFRRIDRNGTLRDAPFNLSATLVDTEGLHRDADGTYLVVEDDPSRLLRIAPNGDILMELPGFRFQPPMEEPQGVTRDPYSGNILVVDDNEGLNALFELSPDGEVLSVTPLSEYGRDAEGVALQPETGRLFIGFDGGRAIAFFDWVPSRNSIDTPLDRGPDCTTS